MERNVKGCPFRGSIGGENGKVSGWGKGKEVLFLINNTDKEKHLALQER